MRSGRAGTRTKAPSIYDQRYADLPLPSPWLPVLEQLKPSTKAALPADLPPMVDWIRTAIAVLGERERAVLQQRWGDGLTLEAVGESEGVTRERIRQIEAASVQRISAMAPAVVEHLLAWIEPERKPLLALVQAPRTSVVALRMCIALGARILDRSLRTRKASDDLWVIYDEAQRGTLLRGIRKLTAEARHLPVPLVQKKLGVDDEGLDTLIHLFPDVLFPTFGGLIGFRWKKIDHVVAVARALEAAGFREWHTSEMSKALGFLLKNPRAYSSRRIIAIVTRPDKRDVFEHVGRRGEWRLAEFGDGAHDNFEAVTTLLKQSRTPLHVHDIESLLDRNVERATLGALLRTSSQQFRMFASSVFGLADKKYAKRTATEKWLAQQMNGQDHVPLAEIWPIAASSGIPTHELRGAAAISDRLTLIGGRGRAPFRIAWR